MLRKYNKIWGKFSNIMEKENEKYIKSKMKSREYKSVQMFMVKYQKRALARLFYWYIWKNANIK